jgi:hypothetical protein
MVITRINPMSAARIAGVLYAFMGLCFGFLFSAMSILGAGPGGEAGAIGAFALGTAAVFLMPIFYGLFGFVGTLIGAVIYNVLAGALGGIEIETQSAVPPLPPPL